MLEQIIKFTVETLYLLLRCSDRHQNVVHTHTKKNIYKCMLDLVQLFTSTTFNPCEKFSVVYP